MAVAVIVSLPGIVSLSGDSASSLTGLDRPSIAAVIALIGFISYRKTQN
jgi:hypothetical protein